MSNTADTQNDPRRWWIALLLALMAMAPGYLYVGRPLRAALVVAGLALLSVALWSNLWGKLATPTGYFALCAIVLFGFAFVVIDIVRLAIQQRHAYARRWYNRWWVYLPVTLVIAMLSGIATEPGLGLQSIRPFSASSGSSSPALLPGDHFITNLRAYDETEPKRGDLVVFRLPRDPKVKYIKRLIGLPGDRVKMADGKLILNGKLVPQQRDGHLSMQRADSDQLIKIEQNIETLPNGSSYRVLNVDNKSPFDNTREFKLEADQYFVLGDHRDNSTDSRAQWGVGMVPRENIMGRVAFIYWSRDWSRIGRRLNVLTAK